MERYYLNCIHNCDNFTILFLFQEWERLRKENKLLKKQCLEKIKTPPMYPNEVQENKIEEPKTNGFFIIQPSGDVASNIRIEDVNNIVCLSNLISAWIIEMTKNNIQICIKLNVKLLEEKWQTELQDSVVNKKYEVAAEIVSRLQTMKEAATNDVYNAKIIIFPKGEVQTIHFGSFYQVRLCWTN